MKNPRSILMLVIAAAFSAACDQNAVQQISGPPEGGAFVKFFHFAPGGPAVNFFVDDAKVTGISTATCAILTDANREACTTTGGEATTGTNYGGAGHGGNAWYSDFTPGQHTLSGRIAAATDKNLPISNLEANLVEGRFYSFYLSGVYDPVAKTTQSFIIEDPIPAVDHSVAQVRFVNAVANANPMTLHATNRTTEEQVAIGGQVAYAAGGTFTILEPGAYDLVTRYTAGGADVITRTNVSFLAGRVYTIGARGDATGTMALDNTANR